MFSSKPPDKIRTKEDLWKPIASTILMYSNISEDLLEIVAAYLYGDLKIGQHVDALDEFCRWYPAHIRLIDYDLVRAFIRYDMWSCRYENGCHLLEIVSYPMAHTRMAATFCVMIATRNVFPFRFVLL